MTTQELAYEVISRLKKEYPDADCTLDYDDAWKLLVSVRLAAQCTDARVNVVVQDLYAKYPDVEALAAADRSHCTSLRPWKKQSPGHQRLYAHSPRTVSRQGAGRL